MGSITEPVGKNGITHLIEHLSFRRAKDLVQTQIYAYCENRGVKINAKTGKNYLVYEFSCRKECFDDILHLLGDMLTENNYTEEDLAIEKSIINHETEIKCYDLLYEEIDNKWFNASYSNSVLGTPETLKNISSDDVKIYKQKILESDCIAVLVGCFTDANVDAINTIFPHSAKSKNSLPINKRSAPSICTPINISCCKQPLMDICYTFHLDVENSNNAISVNVLDNVLFRGDKAFIVEYLREKMGFLYEIDSAYSVINNELVWAFSFSASKDSYLRILANLEPLLNSFVLDEQYLNYVKAFYCDNVPMQTDDLNYMCTFPVDSYALFGEVFTPQKFSEKVKSITLQEYNAVYQRLLPSKQMSVLGDIKRSDRKRIRELIS